MCVDVFLIFKIRIRRETRLRIQVCARERRMHDVHLEPFWSACHHSAELNRMRFKYDNIFAQRNTNYHRTCHLFHHKQLRVVCHLLFTHIFFVLPYLNRLSIFFIRITTKYVYIRDQRIFFYICWKH